MLRFALRMQMLPDKKLKWQVIVTGVDVNDIETRLGSAQGSVAMPASETGDVVQFHLAHLGRIDEFGGNRRRR